MNEQKQHDWLAALFFSPDKTPQDLADYGITPDTASLQDIDYYKEIPQIREVFGTETGELDEVRFRKFYFEVEKLYNLAEQENLVGNIANTFEYDPYDTFAPKNSKTKDVSSKLVFFSNADDRSSGLSNAYQTSAPSLSIREIGQKNKVFNYEKQQWEDYTPNDLNIWENFTRPTLVLAQWDEDGSHIVDNRTVQHKKGEYKLNDLGEPYYETLGNRRLSGKEILSFSDTLTVDGSAWNKWDPFDSDGVDKSVGSTIAQTVLRAAPLFIPYVGTAYKIAAITLELGKLLPELYQAVEGIVTNDISTSKSANFANDIANYFHRFDQNYSDYGKQSFWNVEHLGEIVASSFIQLNTQRLIGEIPRYIDMLRGVKTTENTVKWGRGLATAYMAGTSITSTYDAYKNAGASDRMAGFGMLASMFAMHKLMSTDYFRDFWFNGTYLDNKEFRNVISQVATKEFSKNVTKKEAANWIVKTANTITDKIMTLKPNNILYGALNEGIEETMEEVGTDTVKALFSALNYLGLADNHVDYDFGFSAKDIASRYITSFVGGAIGGSIFSAQMNIENWVDNRSELYSEFAKDLDGLGKLIYWVQQGKSAELYKELRRLHKNGKLGSTNLSWKEKDMVKDGDTYVPQYRPAKPGESQNDLVYNYINGYIKLIEDTLNTEGLNISDNDLAALSMHVGIDLTRDQAKSILSETHFQHLINSKLYSRIFEEFHRISTDIVSTRIAIENKIHGSSTDSQTPSAISDRLAALENDQSYQELKEKLEKLREEKNDLVSGKFNDYYLDLMLFAAHPEIAANFIPTLGIHNYTKHVLHKDYNSLTSDEQAQVQASYATYSLTAEKQDVLAAHEAFSDLREKLSPVLKQIAKDIRAQYSDTINYVEERNKIEGRLRKIEQDLNLLSDEDVDEKNRLLAEQQQLSTKRSLVYLQNANTILRDTSNLDPNVIKDIDLTNPQQWDAVMSVIEDHRTAYISRISDTNVGYYHPIDLDFSNIINAALILQNIDGSFDSWKTWLGDKLGYDIDADDSIANNLLSNLTKFHNSVVRGDWKSIIETWNTIISDDYFNASGYLDVLGNIQLGKSTIGKFILDYKTARNNKIVSPIYQIFDTFAKALDMDLNSWDLLSEAFMSFSAEENLENYVITDSKKRHDLQQINHMINMIWSVLYASKSVDKDWGVTSRINVYRDLLGKELLPTLTEEQVESLRVELYNLQWKLEWILKIAEYNNMQKARVQKDIEINMRSLFLNLLTSSSPAINKFESVFRINLRDTAIACNIPPELNDATYDTWLESVVEFETRIYNAIKDTGKTDQEIAKDLISCFNPIELIRQVSTKLSQNTTTITEYDQFIYLSSILASPAQNFYAEYKNNLPENLLPIYSQELAVRLAYSQIVNTEFYNYLMDEIKTLATQHGISKYEQTKSEMHNIFFIFGGAGVGKSTGVATIIKNIFANNSNIKVAAPTTKQATKLKNILKVNLYWTKDDLFKEIVENNVAYEGLYDGNSLISVVASEQNIKTVNYGNKPTILFIDEISLFARHELELLSKWAKKNNIKIVALGDYRQNSIITKLNGTSHLTGIEDTLMIKSPDLIAPLRPNNIAKHDNYIYLNTVLDFIYQNIYTNPLLGITSLGDITTQYLLRNPINFKYFESDNDFGGEKFIAKEEVKDYIDKLKNLGTLCIITNNPGNYGTIQNVTVRNPTDVQGDEFDYIIIDVPQDPNNYINLKNLYTLTQRSTKGTIIVGAIHNINSVLDPESANSLEISENALQEFLEWKEKGLSKLKSELVPIRVNQITPDPTIAAQTTLLQAPQTVVPQTVVPQSNSTPQPTVTSAQQIVPAQTSIVQNTLPDDQQVTPQITPIQSHSIPNIIESPDLNAGAVNIVTNGNMYLRAEAYYNFMTSLTETILEQEWPGLYNKLLKQKVGFAQQLTELHKLRSYFTFGYYKKEGNLFGNMITPNLKNARFFIIAKKSNKYLIARTEIDLDTVEIPLFLVPNNTPTGEYHGDIEIASYPRFKTMETMHDLTEVSPYNSNYSEIKILMCHPDKLDDFTEDQLEWYKIHTGRTFIIMSDDPFLDKSEFENFIEITTQSDMTTYTTQHDRRMGLIGMQWSATLDEYFAYCKFNTEYLSEKQFSRMCSMWLSPDENIKSMFEESALNKVRDQILSYLENIFFNKKEYSPRIIVNKEVFYTYTDFVNYINEHPIKSIYFKGNKNKTKYNYTDFIIAGLNNPRILSDEAKSIMEEILMSDPIYQKYKIYGNIRYVRIVDGVLYQTGTTTKIPNSVHETNAVFLGNDFVIDATKINLSEDEIVEEQLIETVNEQLTEDFNKYADTYGYTKRIITNLTDIPTLIKDVNEEVRLKAKTPIYGNLVYDPISNNLYWTEITDPINFIVNYFATSINRDQIHFYNTNNSNFQPFFVSLSDGISNYVLVNESGVYTIKTFNSAKEYSDLSNYIKNRQYDPTIESYLDAVLNDIPFNINSDNIRVLSMLDEDLQNLLDNYLLAKIKNNECM